MCAMNPAVEPETIDNVIRQVDRVAQSEASKLRKVYRPNVAKKLCTHCQKCPGVDVFQDVHYQPLSSKEL
ncbi:hypothetical protein ASPSYDRAFT_780691 [Aspergillus sydowii CBS 593.65]|uniref:Uncharacterized protein n=1 Tax=Aspergillus sydowii CBS 593.65 TaxID=1036612 RepID=A0A1L9TNG1_9EURO|nr:uncharacterized protein ASPSYDRAFT_780691 [Aspergillus sydowii CBS 593.65]OJJ60954.1 hypothetical protein ASPSYDRAFT_780691 [Aspergillus sydowii CBS 593.65]